MCSFRQLAVLTLALLAAALPRAWTAATPAISDITKDIVAAIGDDVEFNCTVTNVGRMSVSWAKYTGQSGSGTVVLSMRNILSLSDPRYAITETKDAASGSATYAFRISKIEASDMGPYECQVIVSAVDKITKKLTLAIKHPPRVLEERVPTSKLITEGHNLQVGCYAEGFPQPTISWRREDNAILPAGGHIQPGPVLRIKQVHRLDRGNYYCIADNGVGRPAEHRILVEVEFRPQIAVPRPKIAQVLWHTAELECSVQAYPAPAVLWFRNGAQLQSDSQFQITNMASAHETTTSVLRIASVAPADFGDYYCNATNKLGHADARLHLFQPVIPVPSSA